jgi:type II secretory pathway component GspD/PulD (secretin)
MKFIYILFQRRNQDQINIPVLQKAMAFCAFAGFTAIFIFGLCNFSFASLESQSVSQIDSGSRSIESIEETDAKSKQKIEPAGQKEDDVSLEGQSSLQKKVSLDLRSMDVVDTIRFLAKEAGVNIVTTDSVSGRITFFLEDVSVVDVLEMIASTNSLALTKKGNIVTVMTESEYEKLYGEKYTSMKESKVLTLKYADPGHVKKLLENISSEVGKVVANDSTGTILVIDTPKRIDEMEKAIEKIDIPTIERVIPTITEEFELSYAQAGQIKNEIQELLSQRVGKMRVDERTNKIMVTDLAHNIEKVKQLVKAFDSKPREVFIEAKIIEVTFTDEYAWGIEWEKLFSKLGGLKDVNITGSFPSNPVSTSSLSLNVGSLEAHNYSGVIDLIEEIGHTRILSWPQIRVAHNQEARFMVGTREAYVTQEISQDAATTTVVEEVEFLDVGVTLFVTPRINKEGFVRMDIKPEVSSIIDWLRTEEGTIVPIVDTSNLETTALVKSGHTIILAGFIRDQTRDSLRKVPVLGNVPVLGGAFRGRDKTGKRVNLLVLITPTIIGSEEETIKAVKEDLIAG